MGWVDTLQRALLPAVLVLLVALWLGGGVTEDGTSMDEALELLSLPVLAMAASVWLRALPASRLSRWGMGLALGIAVLVAVQLLPLPEFLWRLPAARASIAAELAQAGVTAPDFRWSLAPAATEQGLWALLPALACFFAALALDAAARRLLLQVIVGLAAFNVLFAFFQTGLPPDSPLRLYPEADAGFGGLFANTNHQATACIVGMVLAVGLAAELHWRARHADGHAPVVWGYAALAFFFLLATPLSTARAGVAIALPALALVVAMAGVLPGHRIWRSKRALAAALGLCVLVVLGGQAALGWMAVDLAEEQRHLFAEMTFALGRAHAPLGSGVGSFVPVFNAAIPDVMQEAYFVNHAHNEYVQWWLETGVAGMLILLGVLVLLGMVCRRLLRLQGRGPQAILAAAAWVAIVAVLAHSWADYPLRTLSLMATTAALAGVMLGALADAAASRHVDDSSHRH